jgi:hypothetical protein
LRREREQSPRFLRVEAQREHDFDEGRSGEVLPVEPPNSCGCFGEICQLLAHVSGLARLQLIRLNRVFLDRAQMVGGRLLLEAGEWGVTAESAFR